MPATPEGLPSLSTSTQISTYDAIQVADRVLWPIVDEYWRADFRQLAEPGDNLALRKSTSYDGSFYVVDLKASVETYEKKKSKVLGINHGIVLTIGKVLVGYQRSLVLNEAYDSGDIGKKHMTSSHVLAQSVREYFTSTDNTFAMTTYQAVAYLIDLDDLWNNYMEDDGFGNDNPNEPPIDDEMDKTPFIESTDLLEIDMEQIEAAAYVLDAPKTALKGLRKIRQNPKAKRLKIKKL